MTIVINKNIVDDCILYFVNRKHLKMCVFLYYTKHQQIGTY